MPFLSIWQIDFITAAGASHRLLDHGDEMVDPLDISADQQGSTFSAIGAAWGSAAADGAARRSIGWSRMVSHASHTAAFHYVQTYPALFPFGQSGKLRITVQGGATFDHFDALISSIPTVLKYDTAGFDTDTLFRATTGRTVPVSGLPLTPGLPFSWILPAWSGITPAWASL